jgi:hypothetical protein
MLGKKGWRRLLGQQRSRRGQMGKTPPHLCNHSGMNLQPIFAAVVPWWNHAKETVAMFMLWHITNIACGEACCGVSDDPTLYPQAGSRRFGPGRPSKIIHLLSTPIAAPSKGQAGPTSRSPAAKGRASSRHGGTWAQRQDAAEGGSHG